MKIKFNGIEREILSFEEAEKLESVCQCYNMLKISSLTEYGYLSILFNNFGFRKTPKTIKSLENKSMEEITNDLVSIILPPVTKNKLVIKSHMSLYDLAKVIENWLKLETERGYLIEKYSLDLPSDKEIKFNISNGIAIKRCHKIEQEQRYWNKNNLFFRRWHNLSPLLDLEYYNAAINDFYNLSKNITIHNGYIVFISYFVNPDIFLSIIRNAEKEAYNNLSNLAKIKNIPPILIHKNTELLLKEFQKILNRKIEYMQKAYNSKGINAFIIEEDNQYAFNNNPNYIISQFNRDVICSIKTQIRNAILDGDHKSFISQYVNTDSLKILDNLEGTHDELRLFTYKKLYWFLTQIKTYFPELLNRDNKFLFSNSFFVSDQVFGLYLPKERNLFVTNENLELCIMNLQEAREYFKFYYGIEVELDPNVIKDSFESPKVKEMDIEVLDMKKTIKNNNPTNIIVNNVPNTVPNNTFNYYQLNENDIVRF